MSDNSSKTNGETALEGSRVGGIDVDRLRRHVEAIEHLDDDIRDLNRDKSECYQLAKSDGFNLAAIRVVIKRRRMDRADRVTLDYDAELYERALSGMIEEREPQVAPEHLEALAAGRADGYEDTTRSAENWPAGVYGHADYWRGHAEGEEERASRARTREEDATPAAAQRRGRRAAAEAFAS